MLLKRLFFCLLVSFFHFACFAQTGTVSHYAKLTAFPVADVRISPGVFKQAEDIDKKVILSIEPDRLLYTFRKNAGLDPKGVKPYGGWEDPTIGLRGHTMGHYLTALSFWYAQSKEIKIKQRIDYLVSSLAVCQQKFGNGYLSAFPQSDVENFEKTGKGWAPYYTIHKILQGLLDAYQLGNNEQALVVARQLGNWLNSRPASISDIANWKKVLDFSEQGGIGEGLLNLYALTGDISYKNTAEFFEQKTKFDPAYRQLDVLNQNITENFHHANATVPQFIGAERKFELTGDLYYLKAANFFWQQVALHRSFSNGTTGFHEHWNLGPDSLFKEAGLQAGETCVTYNMIKLSNDLFRMQPQAKYADFVERALYNDILSALNTKNGGMMYFHTQQPGGFKTFGKNLEVFWCCTGTGMEDHVRYAESIYFHDQENIYVNQYISSSVSWKAKGQTWQQNSYLPEKSKSIFIVKGKAANYSINLRVPYWVSDEMKVTINGRVIHTEKADNGYITITRRWKNDDTIEVNMPMSFHLDAMPDAPKYASLMLGPLVLAADPGLPPVPDTLVMTTDYFYGKIPEAYDKKVAMPQITGSTKNFEWLNKVKNHPLFFFTNNTNTGQQLKFMPLYMINNQRFASYLQFKEK